VDLLIGDYSKAKAQLGWEPLTRMKDLAVLMTEADMELAVGEAKTTSFSNPGLSFAT
jgi:GDPmannose 4,6-dehydratase